MFYHLTFLFLLGVLFNSNSSSRCSCRQASWEQVWLGKLLHQIAVILGNLILDNFYCVNWCCVLCFHGITSLLGAKFFQVKVWNIVNVLLNLYILEVVKSSLCVSEWSEELYHFFVSPLTRGPSLIYRGCWQSMGLWSLWSPLWFYLCTWLLVHPNPVLQKEARRSANHWRWNWIKWH